MARVSSKVDDLEKRKLSITMLESGFKISVIEIVTGVSNSMIRAFRTELGGLVSGRSNAGQLKFPNRIVDNRIRSIDAGILLKAYLKIAEYPRKSVDILALIEAHSFYMDSHLDIYGRKFHPIDINEAFVLAREYRVNTGTIMLHACTCGADYVTVSKQRMSAGCPSCSMESKGCRKLDDGETASANSSPGKLVSP